MLAVKGEALHAGLGLQILIFDFAAAKVIEILKSVIEVATLHVCVDLWNQFVKCCLHIRRRQRTRLHKINSCTK